MLNLNEGYLWLSLNEITFSGLLALGVLSFLTLIDFLLQEMTSLITSVIWLIDLIFDTFIGSTRVIFLTSGSFFFYLLRMPRRTRNCSFLTLRFSTRSRFKAKIAYLASSSSLTFASASNEFIFLFMVEWATSLISSSKSSSESSASISYINLESFIFNCFSTEYSIEVRTRSDKAALCPVVWKTELCVLSALFKFFDAVMNALTMLCGKGSFVKVISKSPFSCRSLIEPYSSLLMYSFNITGDCFLTS